MDMEEYEDEVTRIEINTPKSGRLSVFTQGSKRNLDVAIITCHDIGCNHTQFTEFLKNDMMRPIVKRFMWIHVVVPGQTNKDDDLPAEYRFPSLQDIADDIIHVINHLGVNHVVPFGEGAGANILARFTMRHDDRVLGAVFIDLVGHSDNVITKTSRKISVTRKLSSQGMHHAAEEYLIHHRFGSMKSSAETEKALHSGVEAFKKSLHSSINSKNLNEYIMAFMNRSSIKDKVGSINCPVLLMTAHHSAQTSYVSDMHYCMQQARADPVRRSKVEIVVMDDICNVLIEAPGKVAESFQFFLQGLGLGSSLVNRKISSNSASLSAPDAENRSRSTSMADFDQPRGQTYYKRLSTVSPPGAISS